MSALNQVVLLLAIAVVAVALAKKLRLGSVLGYLGAGIAVGPWGLNVISDVEKVLHLSEYGVVFLLFIVGLELSPSRLWVMRRAVFGLGGAQVLATGFLLALIAYGAFGIDVKAAAVGGLGLSLSSTAFVLPLLSEKGRVQTTFGQASFAILLFQDLAVIPALALLPLLGTGIATLSPSNPLLSAFKALVLLVTVVVGGRYLVRPIFKTVAQLQTQEIFTAMALLVVVGTASLVTLAGMSMTLGAFLAGVLLADSEYRHELQADIEPFKGLLLGLFFMGVGMSTNVGLVRDMPLKIAGFVILLLTAKAAVIYLVSRVAGYSRDESRNIACTLPQGGEFAFVLFGLAVSYQLLSAELADLLTLVVTLSMAMTPLVFALNEKMLAPWLSKKEKREYDTIEEKDNAVIIAGFGRVGQIVGRVLRMRGINFTALEANPTQVDFVRKFGAKIYFGDASRIELLRAANADKAKVFVLAIDDVVASFRTAEMVKKNFPHLDIYARARNRQHAYQLMALGVKVLQRETFHSSVVLSEHVLVGLGFSQNEARRSVEMFAEHDEAALHAQFLVRHDEKLLIQTSKQAAEELESLFVGDEAAKQSSSTILKMEH